MDATVAITAAETGSWELLWQPGRGGALVWVPGGNAFPPADPDRTQLPSAVAAIVAGRTPRSLAVNVVGVSGQPEVRVGAATTLLPAALLAVLEAWPVAPGDDPVGSPPDPAAPESVRFFGHLSAVVDAFLAAGRFGPGFVLVDGQWYPRWELTPGPELRAVLADTVPPPVVSRNGGPDSVLGFLNEIADARAAASVPEPSIIERAPASAGVAAAWEAWVRSSRPIAGSGAAVLFRLREPDDHGEFVAPVWVLEPRLAENPDGAGGLAAMSDHDLDTFTTGLAAAFKAVPLLGDIEPLHQSLDIPIAEARILEFLDTSVGSLRAAGFEVLLPAGIARPTPTLRLVPSAALHLSAEREVKAGKGEIEQFYWQLALGDRILTAAEVTALADGNKKVFRAHGAWIRADAAAVAATARYVDALAADDMPMTPADVFAVMAGLDGAGPGGVGPDESAPAAITADSFPDDSAWDWVRAAAAGTTLELEPVAVPAALHATLRDYQEHGMRWLVGMGARGLGTVLADDMGLGKTIQVLAAELAVRTGAVGAPSAPTLVVCPLSVVGNWAAEANRFAPELRVLIHHGPDRLAGKAFAAAAANVDLVITTFSLIHRDTTTLAGIDWDGLVVDEAQHVKNVRTAAARGLRAITARRRIALTGTPVENRIEDLRAIIDLVNPGLLGSASVFHARYGSHVERERSREQAERLTRLTRPFLLRREKTDPAIISTLPEKLEYTVRASLTEEQVGLYQAAVNQMKLELAKHWERTTAEHAQVSTQRRSGAVLTALTRLKQICNHPALVLGEQPGADAVGLVGPYGEHRSGKMELVCELADTIVADGDRALLFTQYARFGHLLSGWLADRYGHDVPFLHGGLTRQHRDGIVADFQSGAGSPLLIISLRAGGTGLNLTAANHVIHVDRWWNPAVENQATDRAYRIGQDRTVQVRTLVCAGTVEERIDRILSDKTALSNLVIGAGGSVGPGGLLALGDNELAAFMALNLESRDRELTGNAVVGTPGGARARKRSHVAGPWGGN